MRLKPRTVRTLDEFDIRERLCFLSAWSPRDTEFRWRSWAEYLTDYQAIREELLEQHRTGARADFRRPFGDDVLRYRQRHGAAALESATFEDICDGRED